MDALIPIGIVVVAIVAIYLFVNKILTMRTYNEIVRCKNNVKNSWAHIDAQLQRRFDLIPNLVSIVQSFAIREIQVLDSVSNVLAEYQKANTAKEKLAMDAQLSACLKSLYTLVENYPNLQANSSFLQMQAALTEIEEDISYARQFYNDAVTIYNNKIMSYPGNKIAAQYNFKEECLFDAVKEAEVAPIVKINTHLTKDRQCPVCGAAVQHGMQNCQYCGCALH